MPDVRAVLFDLDDTLFDHTHATRKALARLRADEQSLASWTTAELEARHSEVLELLHLDVLTGSLSIDAAREERFRRLLAAAGADGLTAGRASALASLYRDSYLGAWQAVPGATALLASVKRAGLTVAVVTNNLTAEQRRKIDGVGLAPYVDQLITSEAIGVMKPDVGIFRAALDAVGVVADEAVVVGDAWPIDIAGARAAGIRAVWFNRAGLPSPDPSVQELESLEPAGHVLRILLARSS